MPLCIDELHAQVRMREKRLVKAVGRHESRAQTELEEEQEEERRYHCEFQPCKARIVVEVDGVDDEEGKEQEGKRHRRAQHALPLCLFKEEKERREDLAEPEEPIVIGAPREMLFQRHGGGIPDECEELVVQIVAENQRGQQEVQPENRAQPARHFFVEHILIRCPGDPEECNREPRAEHIVEVRQKVLQGDIDRDGKEFCNAGQLPEEQHRNQQKDGAPRTVMEDACAQACTPENRDDKDCDENDQALMRFDRREHRMPQNYLPIERVRLGEFLEECVGIVDLRSSRRRCDRIARCAQIAPQGIGKGDGLSREQSLGKGERSFLRHTDAQRGAVLNELLRFVRKEHIDIPAAVLLRQAVLIAASAVADAQPILLLQPREQSERLVEVRVCGQSACQRQKENLPIGAGIGKNHGDILPQIVPTLHGDGAVLRYGEDDHSGKVRIPIELFCRAADKLLRLKIIELDSIGAVILKDLQEIRRESLRIERLRRGAAQGVGIGRAEVVRIDERQRLRRAHGCEEYEGACGAAERE